MIMVAVSFANFKSENHTGLNGCECAFESEIRFDPRANFGFGTLDDIDQVCQASGGGGTSERPVAASTIEPSAGQYIKQAVQPG
jgi:hypothetical protein